MAPCPRLLSRVVAYFACERGEGLGDSGVGLGASSPGRIGRESPRFCGLLSRAAKMKSEKPRGRPSRRLPPHFPFLPLPGDAPAVDPHPPRAPLVRWGTVSGAIWSFRAPGRNLVERIFARDLLWWVPKRRENGGIFAPFRNALLYDGRFPAPLRRADSRRFVSNAVKGGLVADGIGDRPTAALSSGTSGSHPDRGGDHVSG
ncbi:hypothetical protein NL676_022981 [Syzygium grande]|nr:hypothetical protein NL676_022981 [Syzygium grande]